MSDLRKQGHDPSIADFLLRNVNAKIQWAIHNNLKEDYDKIESIFNEVEREIKEESERGIVNVKKEVRIELKGEEKVKDAEIVRDVKPVIVEEKKEDIVNEELGEEHYKGTNKEIKYKPKIIKNSEQYFNLKSGKVLKSIDDLVYCLPSMSDEDFYFHTRKFDNDFAKWLKKVFEEEKLAKKIKGLNNKDKMFEILTSSKRGE